jgi:peptidyl-prolyl cis-trans isomerase B (cyclophilin B)
VASKSERQRKLERARAERRLARQAHRARRRRQTQAAVAAGLALVVIVVGATWLLGGFDRDPEPADSNVVSGTCSWTVLEPEEHPNLTDVAHPPTTGERREGTDTMTIRTNQGVIEVRLDLSRAPCTASSFAHLGRNGFYAGTTCHRLSTDMLTLACGDPKGDGSGGPTYQFTDEDVPAEPIGPRPTPTSTAAPPSDPAEALTYYAKGTVVLINQGVATNGSQFQIVYGDKSPLGPSYSVVGTVVKGLDIVEKVARAGLAEEAGPGATEGKPKTALTIEELYVGQSPTGATPTPSADPTPSASASPQS